MTDYPTRAEIVAAANTIEALQNCVDRGVPAWGVTWSGLETAREILTQLDAVPGVLHYPDPEPEPEPQPTAVEVLWWAFSRAEAGNAEESILLAAHSYAEDHPEWFQDWQQWAAPHEALTAARHRAYSNDRKAWYTLGAAACVARNHPDLFGGDA